MTSQQNSSDFALFLKHNQSFIQQKHLEYFPEIKTIKLNNILDHSIVPYLFDILGLNKYKENEELNNKLTLSLEKNIKKFILLNQNKSGDDFTSKIAIQLLIYCIENNELFAVQYEVSSALEDQRLPQKSGNLNIQFYSQEKAEYSLKINKQISRHISNDLNKSQNNRKYTEVQNQFDINDSGNGMTPEMIKKNAKIAFDLYCKNQMELGGNKTFDRLSEEASTMTIGKLLVYAKAYNMTSLIINKDILMRKFKKISEGKRAINFQQFYSLLLELNMLDSKLFERLQLSEVTLCNNIKFVKFPFYTQDQSPRQIVSHRNFINKLTAHSGKTQNQLKLQIMNRKAGSKSLSTQLNPIMKSAFSTDLLNNRSNKISPSDLLIGKSNNYSIQLSFIDKIVSPEENDEKWLLDHPLFNKSSENAKQSKSKSIVQNIKKRIAEIQNSQKRDLSHLSKQMRRYKNFY